jgi:hypothetical protein
MFITLALVPATLLVAGMPIFLVLLTASAVTVLFVMDVPAVALHQTLFGAVDSFALLAVPFFIYAGELMGRGSVAKRIVDIMQAALGCDEAPRAVYELARRHGAPVALKEIGMRAEDIDRAADLAMANPYWSPRPLERSAIAGLLRRAFEGEPPAID